MCLYLTVPHIGDAPDESQIIWAWYQP